MRKQFVKTTEDLLATDPNLVVLLGDIGVFGFKNSFAAYPKRIYNIGILEQATIGVAAGLSKSGLIPVVHTIAPFITERCFEQIKDDFGYQELGGNLVSVGASYDYAALGCTHHCPADVPILMNIPDVEIVVPGTAEEFDTLFRQSYADGKLTYFRLSERKNQYQVKAEFGKAQVIKKGTQGTVIVVGPLLDKVIAATKDLDVTVLYLTTIRPLDKKTLSKHLTGDNVMICEPYYSGSLVEEVLSCSPKALRIGSIAVPKKFLNKYGSAEELDEYIGFTERNIFTKIKKLIHG